MKLGKILIKKSLARLFHTGRFFAVLERRCLREKAFVLMYHRVLNSSDFGGAFLQAGMYVTTESFERQVAFLKNKYHLLKLDELIANIKQGEDVGGCCAVTFDDGWQDNYLNAFPILEKYQIPATIFLATSFIGGNRLFWPDEVSAYLDRRPLTGKELLGACPCVDRFLRQVEVFRPKSREMFLNHAIELLKDYSPGERADVLEFFREKMGERELPTQMMTWEQAGVMADSGLVTFGSHTAEHEILDQLSAAEIRDEILRSQEEIRRHLGEGATTFAYPNGNYNDTVKEILLEERFVGAVTTKKGFLSRDTSLMEIPRIGIHEDISDTIPMFHGRILLGMF